MSKTQEMYWLRVDSSNEDYNPSDGALVTLDWVVLMKAVEILRKARETDDQIIALERKYSSCVFLGDVYGLGEDHELVRLVEQDKDVVKLSVAELVTLKLEGTKYPILQLYDPRVYISEHTVFWEGILGGLLLHTAPIPLYKCGVGL